VIDRLRTHPWPGNVRQLEHAVETAVVMSGDREVLEANDFLALRPAGANSTTDALPPELVVSPDGVDFEETISRLEWSLIQQALALSNGNKARAAELLRMKRTTLLARVRSLEARREFSVAMAACA
jgi:DNA-binding NtrC family response regulator